MDVLAPIAVAGAAMFLSAAALAGCVAQIGGTQLETHNAPIAAPARDGNVAILEEYEAAVIKNTIEAFELFIRRHPDHPNVALAQEHIRRLGGSVGN